MTEYSTADKLKAVNREIAFRVRVYGRRVAEGKMSKSKADYEIEIMKAIANDYIVTAMKEDTELPLWKDR